MGTPAATIRDVIQRNEQELLNGWVQTHLSAGYTRRNLLDDKKLHYDARRLLELLQALPEDGADLDRSPTWGPIRDVLGELSRQGALQGLTPSETAGFVFSLKEALFSVLRRELAKDPKLLAETTWHASALLDKLGLYTTEVYQKNRDQVIVRQQQELLELSTPVVELWNGILALPVIGTLDSARTQIVMENLLQRIVETGADIAIIDITGVPTVDTLVAQHLLKTVSAARLMGAECIISGIRPQIAQTIVQLGVELQGVITKSTLASAFAIALERRALRIVSRGEA